MADTTEPAAALAEAKRIADGLHFACRIPGKAPDFTSCGGPAAEAYWAYFTPARIVSLLAAIEAPLKLADDWDAPDPQPDDRMNVRQDCAVRLRAAITAALAGKEAGDDGPT